MSVEGGNSSASYSWGTGYARCRVDASVSYNSNTQATISFSGAARSGNDAGNAYRISGYWVTVTVSCNGQSASAGAAWDYTTWVANASGSVTVARGSSDKSYTVTCSYQGSNGSGNSGSVSMSVTVAKIPYTAPPSPDHNKMSSFGTGDMLVGWYNNSSSTGTPTSVTLQTSVNDGSFSTVKSGSIFTNYTFAASLDSKYQYKVWETNAYGSSGSVSGTWYTRPASPSDVSLSLFGKSKMNIFASSNAKYPSGKYDILIKSGAQGTIHSLYVRSAPYQGTHKYFYLHSGIMIDGTKYESTPTGRGHVLTIINPKTATVESCAVYDTHGTPTALDSAIQNAAEQTGKIICLYVADSGSITSTARTALQSMGSSSSATWTSTNRPHVFIGMPGLAQGKAYEVDAGAASNDLYSKTVYFNSDGLLPMIEKVSLSNGLYSMNIADYPDDDIMTLLNGWADGTITEDNATANQKLYVGVSEYNADTISGEPSLMAFEPTGIPESQLPYNLYVRIPDDKTMDSIWIRQGGHYNLLSGTSTGIGWNWDNTLSDDLAVVNAFDIDNRKFHHKETATPFFVGTPETFFHAAPLLAHPLVPGKSYTLSFALVAEHDLNRSSEGVSIEIIGNIPLADVTVIDDTITLTTDDAPLTTNYQSSFIVPSNLSTSSLNQLELRIKATFTHRTDSLQLEISDIKLEEGSVKTDWCLSLPESRSDLVTSSHNHNLMKGTDNFSALTGGLWSDGAIRVSGTASLTHSAATYYAPVPKSDCIVITGTSAGVEGGFCQDGITKFEVGDVITFSGWVKASANNTKIRWVTAWNQASNPTHPDNYQMYTTVGTTWTKMSLTSTIKQAAKHSIGYVYITPTTANDKLYVCGLKVERGARATGWCPTVEETLA